MKKWQAEVTTLLNHKSRLTNYTMVGVLLEGLRTGPMLLEQGIDPEVRDSVASDFFSSNLGNCSTEKVYANNVGKLHLYVERWVPEEGTRRKVMETLKSEYVTVRTER